jgi:hypothetical protein
MKAVGNIASALVPTYAPFKGPLKPLYTSSSLHRAGTQVCSNFTYSFHIFWIFPSSDCPFYLYYKICSDARSLVILTKWYIQFYLYSSTLLCTYPILVFFPDISLNKIKSHATFNLYCASHPNSDCIPFMSVALTVQDSLTYTKVFSIILQHAIPLCTVTWTAEMH